MSFSNKLKINLLPVNEQISEFNNGFNVKEAGHDSGDNDKYFN